MDMENPIVNTMAIRCQTSSNWLPIKNAIVKASATLTSLSRTIGRRLSIRSARIPPNSEKNNTGNTGRLAMKSTQNGEPVNSRVSHAVATMRSSTPRSAVALESQKYR